MYYKRTFMRLPEGKTRMLTFSFDDGNTFDERLINIFNKYNMKATFNLNAGLILDSENEPNGRMSKEKARELFANSPHEVACHGQYHTRFESQSISLTAQDILLDRKLLEDFTGKIVRGMAYPFGGVNDNVVEVMKQAGMAYGRTVDTTHGFYIPINMEKDWFRLNPTCNYADPALFEMAEAFLTIDEEQYPYMFYIWGHSSDFEIANNWDVIERFCERMQNIDDVWYATNIEIYDYFQAYNSLQFSYDEKRVYNPSATDVWFHINTKNYVVRAGQMLEIE